MIWERVRRHNLLAAASRRVGIGSDVCGELRRAPVPRQLSAYASYKYTNGNLQAQAECRSDVRQRSVVGVDTRSCECEGEAAGLLHLRRLCGGRLPRFFF